MRRVHDAMLAPPVVVDPTTTVQEAAARMLDARAEVAVVVDRGRVWGLATAEHVAGALADGYDASETLIGTIALRDPPIAREDDPLVDAHQRMRAEGCPVVPVVGAGHEPVGVLVDHEAGV
jgi:CBS domain-containing protein